jgi:hypothetical protein
MAAWISATGADVYLRVPGGAGIDLWKTKFRSTVAYSSEALSPSMKPSRWTNYC